MENLAEIVGQNLTALRKAKGLTQQDVALKLNYSDKSISKWELGYTIPSVDILKDFADFYGVTVDFLLRPQTPETTSQVVKKEDHASRGNKAIILALAVTVVWLIAACVYISRAIFHTPSENLWIAFVWAVPCSSIVAAVLSRAFFGRGVTSLVLLSVFVWSLMVTFSLQFQFVNEQAQNIWYILVVCIPIQVILILESRLKR